MWKVVIYRPNSGMETWWYGTRELAEADCEKFKPEGCEIRELSQRYEVGRGG
jgi:hypothetical protein